MIIYSNWVEWLFVRVQALVCSLRPFTWHFPPEGRVFGSLTCDIVCSYTLNWKQQIIGYNNFELPVWHKGGRVCYNELNLWWMYLPLASPSEIVSFPISHPRSCCVIGSIWFMLGSGQMNCPSRNLLQSTITCSTVGSSEAQAFLQKESKTTAGNNKSFGNMSGFRQPCLGQTHRYNSKPMGKPNWLSDCLFISHCDCTYSWVCPFQLLSRSKLVKCLY